MKLYIDDLRVPPFGWQLARTVTEAIRILATQNITDISIDHDISHSVQIGVVTRPFPCLETFEPIAWYLCAIKFTGPVTLHTANPAGALRMARILKDGGIESVTSMSRPANGLELDQ